MINPQAVTVGARTGRRLNEILDLAIGRSPDPASFAGGLLSAIVGRIAGKLGPQTAAELLRILIGRLDGQPQLELPSGVRLAIAAAGEPEMPAAANEAQLDDAVEPPSEAYVLRLLGRIGELELQLQEARK